MIKPISTLLLLCLLNAFVHTQLSTGGLTTVNAHDIFIDFAAKQCYQRQYQLQGGQIELTFQFSALSMTLQSGVIIAIDNEEVLFVPMKESGKKITIKDQLSKGSHTVRFCPFGCSDTTSFVMITNIVISEKQCFAGLTNDLITNGGFQQTACQSWVCIYDSNNYQNSFVPGWIPDVNIETGVGTLYNSGFKDTRVIELDGHKNSCIKQKLTLKDGKHTLTFNWAARQNTGLASNVLVAKINGKVLKTMNPNDYSVRLEKIDFDLVSAPASSDLEFCDIGISDSLGVVIDNVKLIYMDPCLTSKINKY